MSNIFYYLDFPIPRGGSHVTAAQETGKENRQETELFKTCAWYCCIFCTFSCSDDDDDGCKVKLEALNVCLEKLFC